MRLSVHRSVIREDLKDIFSQIALDHLQAAERFIKGRQGSVPTIQSTPSLGPLYPSGRLKKEGIRMLPLRSGFHSYLVLYRLDGEVLKVLFVVHGARHIQRLFRNSNRD